MKKTTDAAHMARLSLKAKSSHVGVEEDMFTTYVQVINHVLETYATDDMTAERLWKA